MIIVFTSFIFFFGFLIWYADRHNKTVDSNEFQHEKKSPSKRERQLINFMDRENSLTNTSIQR
ncbi:MAG: hypothetical protein C0490_02150 [Marivirga sp.]|nr:hypothetical protein [Marivirga sp.]